MPRRFSTARVFLWLFVIVLGIVIGGGLYEQLVLMPLWSLSPPDSIVAYHQHNVSYPQFAPNPGGRFWVLFMPPAALLTISTLLSGLKTRPEHRKWRMASTILALIIIVFTFVWFVPNITKPGQGGAGLSAGQITDLTKRWVGLNWLRAVLFSAAWLMGLKALTIPAGREIEI